MLKLSKIEVIYAKSFFFGKKTQVMETSFRSFFLWTAPSSGLLVPGAPATEAARTATSSCFVSARWGVSAQTTWGKTEHQKDQGNACNFRWFQHQFLQKLVDV